MEHYIAAIDQGTTSTRCVIVDHDGSIVASDQREHRQILPKPGWVEHDPQEIWAQTRAVVQGALARSQRSGQVAALGVTNQRETTIVWNRHTGEPVCNAIVWQDTRTDRICDQLALEGGRDRFRAQTGLPLATYFSGPKLMWILDQVPGARAGAESGDLLFGNMDTWLIWNLTGRHVTDVTNASRTMLMNLQTLDWDDEVLAAMSIPRNLLPEIRSSSETYGTVQSAVGFPLVGVPVCGDLGDQQAALFGQTCFNPGEAKNTYGTGCFLLMNTGAKPIQSKAGLLTTVAFKLGEQPVFYALEGSVAVAGSLVQWLRDNLGILAASSDVEILANEVEDSAGIYIVPAFSGLFAPYWRSDARGVIVGLTRYVNKGHIARSALEATAYQTRDVLEAMTQDSGVRLASLKVDGGMVRNELLMQFQADILGIPVVRPLVSETTALGAAYAAGLAIGYWRDVGDIQANWRSDRKWEPAMHSSSREALYAGWQRAVTRSLGWVQS